MPNSKELIFEVGPSFIGYNCPFFNSDKITEVFAKTLSWLELGMDGFNPKRGTNLENQHLRVRHMPRLTFFNLGLPNIVSNMAFSSVCGLPLSQATQFQLTTLR